MNLLDENIPLDQRDLLGAWGIRCRVIGQDLAPTEAAMFIRRFLHHPRFRTKVQRLGNVVRVHHDGIQFWQVNRSEVQRLPWTEER